MVRINKGLWVVGVPFLLSYMSVRKMTVVLCVMAILSHFLILKIVPACKRRENLWMFIMVAFSSIPLNLYLIWACDYFCILFDSYFILNIARGALLYLLLFSLEEIVMGVLTRCIWRKQNDFVS